MAQNRKSTKKTDIEFLLNHPATNDATSTSSSSSNSPSRSLTRYSSEPQPSSAAPSSSRGAGASTTITPCSGAGSSSANLEGDSFKCDKCHLTFRWRGNLKKHQNSVHRKLRDEVCSICNKRFAFRDGLMRHVSKILLPIKTKLTFYFSDKSSS